MRLILIIIMCIAFAPDGAGQYTYFNVTNGSENSNGPMTTANVEVIGDQIVTWSGGSDAEGNLAYFFHKFDIDGQLIETVPYYFGEAFVWTGATVSFQKVPNSQESMTVHGISDSEGTHGLIMRMDESLDTLWTSQYDMLPPYTYFLAHTWNNDTLVIAGEFDNIPGGKGTFVSKLNSDGEILSTQVIHEASEGSYRNLFISVAPNGVVVSGASGGGDETVGRVEFFNENTLTLYEFENDEPALLNGIMRHTLMSDGRILVAQYVAYEDYPGAMNPSTQYSKLRLFELNLVSNELEFISDYFNDYSWVVGGIYEAIESYDGSLVLVGGTLLEVDDSLREISHVLKIDSNYNIEWYTELAQEICAGCVNRLYDIESTSDGGYVMAGKFRNTTDTPNDKTWLVKVDACGDVEWQGCAPVGVREWNLKPSFSVYPNPVDDYLNIDISSAFNPERVEILDMSGRLIMRIPFDNRIYVSNLGTGIYLLRMLNEEGVVHSEKLIIE